MTIYRIAKFVDTFTKSEGRRASELKWIALLINNWQSTGYQTMVDDFGPDLSAAYGTWIALVQIAAGCTIPGTLCTSRGTPILLSHIARVTCIDQSDYTRLIEWALKPEVGWLEIVPEEEIRRLLALEVEAEQEVTPHPTTAQQSPNNRPTTAQQPPAEMLGYKTIQDITIQHSTAQHSGAAAAQQQAGRERASVAAAAAAAAGLDFEEIRQQAAKLRKACPQLPVDYVWQTAWIAQSVSPGLCSQVATEAKTGSIKKPKAYIDKILRDECTDRGCTLAAMRESVPDNPFSNTT